MVEIHIDEILGCSYKNIQYSNEIRRLTCRAVERQEAVMRLNDMRDGSNRVKKLREELSEQVLSLTKKLIRLKMKYGQNGHLAMYARTIRGLSRYDCRIQRKMQK